MNVDRLVAILAESEHLSAREIAETLWLAMQIQEDRSPPPPEEPRQLEPVENRYDGEIEPSIADPGNKITEAQSEPTANVVTTPPTQTAGILPETALPLWVSDPPMLDDSLDVIRALRPLLRQVPSGVSDRIDEAQTVDRIAETDIWSPVLEPEREPWFDVVLIVDRNASMNLWGRLVDDLQLVLERYGAFRDLQRWEIEATINAKPDAKANSPKYNVRLRANPNRPSRSPRELLSPNGRRIAIVLSDCVADYWWDGAMLSVLQDWGRAMPTVVWQMLPEWMWERTALGLGNYVALRNAIPGATNAQLDAEVLALEQPDDISSRVALPIVTSEAEELAAWSRVLAGDRRDVTAGFLLPQRVSSVSEGLPDLEEADGEESEKPSVEERAREQIQEFRLLSSLRARQLAALLSAAPVITLPVMRLIRASMLRESSPLPVAEVFLSGLLRRLPEQPNTTDAELVQYDFVEGVREALLDMLPPVDAVEVINTVSFYVSRRLGYSSLKQFKAWLLSPEVEKAENVRGLKSFARVTAQVLKRLGGEYAKLAREFEVVEPPEPPPIVFPELQTCSFDIATVTVVREFVFETATVGFETVERQSGLFGLRRESRSELKINRRRKRAWSFTEDLGDSVELEMVYIPKGTFKMGSPEDEEESFDWERPQRDVSVPEFFMGKYPVTQAQWKAVAKLPRIDRNLNSDPANFKGDKRPVEQVSWLDAVEFCQRLSKHTGRDYRLPSEAEWEYACRAGTKTPFHFGKTITTKLVNYNGNYTYGHGVKGEYREETTPVGNFPANAFGLYDMHGNVWEWCEDDWHENYQDENAPTDGSAWIENNNRIKTRKVRRGGSWYLEPRLCQSAYRLRDVPGFTDNDIGFRVACGVARTL
ncbi:MAG: formylglycine-generating enzyme family protein [Cyanobacteria bacterium SID2]|nr:formylglycine-generating enzyme family protein [Cyanobacteria bacterium SID2]